MRETAYDAVSFSAGQACGTRVSACIARVAAIELVEQARWWNRRRRRLMASALVACAEELESAADSARGDGARRGPELREALRVVR
jgi:hypothetical protein